MFHTECIIPRSFPREVQKPRRGRVVHSARSTVLTLPPVPHRTRSPWPDHDELRGRDHWL